MIGMMVKIELKPDSDAAFEDTFAAQAAAVRNHEPGNRLYDLFRSRTRPGAYTLVEIYDDEAALASHRASPHMAAHRAKTASFVSDEPEIETFDVIVHPA